MAEPKPNINLNRAIDMAESVPGPKLIRGGTDYAQAQLKLREWRSSGNKAPIRSPAPETSENTGFLYLSRMPICTRQRLA